jgi:hypothetical protein
MPDPTMVVRIRVRDVERLKIIARGLDVPFSSFPRVFEEVLDDYEQLLRTIEHEGLQFPDPPEVPQ